METNRNSVKCTGGVPHSAAAQDRENRVQGLKKNSPGGCQKLPKMDRKWPENGPQAPPRPGGTILDHFGDQKKIEKKLKIPGRPARPPRAPQASHGAVAVAVF